MQAALTILFANTDCALGVEQNQEILETILSFMEQYQMEPYDEKQGKAYFVMS